MSRHTSEPWECGESVNGMWYVASKENKIEMLAEIMQEKAEENASRIVDCVNACAGMKNPAHEINRMKLAIIEDVDSWLESEHALTEAYRNVMLSMSCIYCA